MIQQRVKILTGLAIIVSLLLFSYASWNHYMMNNTYERLMYKYYYTDLQNHYNEARTYIVERQKRLEDIAAQPLVKEADVTRVLAYFRTLKEPFMSIGFISLDGFLHTVAGQKFNVVVDADVQYSLRGNIVITKPFQALQDAKKRVIAIRVPVVRNDRVVGVVSAITEVDEVFAKITLLEEKGKKQIYLFAPDGTIIYPTVSRSSVNPKTIYERLQRGGAKHSVPTFSHDSGVYFYLNVANDEWPVAMRMNADVIEAQLDDNLRSYEWSMAVIIAFFIMVSIIAIYLEKRRDEAAFLDSLTKFENRASFAMYFRKYIAKQQVPTAFILFNLNRFRLINEAEGYEAGNEMIRIVAERFHDYFSSAMKIFHLGGDEFLLLYEGDGELLLEQLQQIEQTMSFKVKPHHQLSGSMGVSFYPDHSENHDELLTYASIALHTAKQQQEQRWQIFHPYFFEQTKQAMTLDQQLRQALTEQQFYLVYQPYVSLVTGRVLGVEALIRWRSPERGEVMPNDFIPHIEQSDLILPIGYWVMEEAFKQWGEWQKQWNVPVKMSINISLKQFSHPKFIQQTMRLIEQTNVDPHFVTFEITESTAMSDVETSLKMAEQLIDLGLTLAIDDFGTGYSSLAVLQQLPFTVLKIDRTFVKNITSRQGAMLIKTIIALAQNMRMQVIAEGVETEEQAKLLHQYGCDIIQGYLISRPVEITLQQLQQSYKVNIL